jgi:hypothetical protein
MLEEIIQNILDKLHKDYPDKYRVGDIFPMLAKVLNPEFNFDADLKARESLIKLCPSAIIEHKKELMGYYFKDGVDPEQWCAFAESLETLFNRCGYETCQIGYKKFRDNALIELQQIITNYYSSTLQNK